VWGKYLPPPDPAEPPRHRLLGVNVALATGLQASEGTKAERGQHDGEPYGPACARSAWHPGT
jgi:hypothetical protein